MCCVGKCAVHVATKPLKYIPQLVVRPVVRCLVPLTFCLEDQAQGQKPSGPGRCHSVPSRSEVNVSPMVTQLQWRAVLQGLVTVPCMVSVGKAVNQNLELLKAQ